MLHPLLAGSNTLKWHMLIRTPILTVSVLVHREVVVMAEADKAQMDEEVRQALTGFKTLKWHTRTGAPHCVSDLESVAAGQAHTIILLHPETIEVGQQPLNGDCFND